MAAINGWIALSEAFHCIDVSLLADIRDNMELIYQKIRQMTVSLPLIDLSGGRSTPLIKILPLFNMFENALTLIQDNAILWSEYNEVGWQSSYYQSSNTWNSDGTTALFSKDKGRAIRRIVNYLNELYDVYYRRIGHYCGYTQADMKFNADQTQIYIKQTASDRLCVRFISEHLQKDFVTIEWYFIVNGINYRIYTNNRNGSTHEYFWYGETYSGQKLDPGLTDWYYDTANGSLDIRLDLSSIAGIAAAGGFLIPVINYYQGENWDKLQTVHVNFQYILGL